MSILAPGFQQFGMAHRRVAVHDEFPDILLALQKLLASPQQVLLLLFCQRQAGVDEEEVAAAESQLQWLRNSRCRRDNARANARFLIPMGGRGRQPMGRRRVSRSSPLVVPFNQAVIDQDAGAYRANSASVQLAQPCALSQ